MQYPDQLSGAFPGSGYNVVPPANSFEQTPFFTAAVPDEEYSQSEQDLGDEDFKNMEEIERELLKNMTDDDFDVIDELESEFPEAIQTEAATLPSGALPTLDNGKLSAHAAEFWFPESRNCECCHGFKHGCPCTKAGFLACQIPGCVLEEHRGKMKVVDNIPRSAPVISPMGDDGDNTLCRFELSPQGCRFGASCRFRHSNQQSKAPAPRSASTGANKPCQHFQRGYCMFGEQCRFSHSK